MTARHTKFYLDKQNAKWKGVCAGIADYTGFDATLIRLGFLLLTFLGSGMTIPAYIIIAWIAPVKPVELVAESPEQAKFWQNVRASPARTARDVRARFRGIDRRLADVEAYVTSSNGRLAREIESLR